MAQHSNNEKQTTKREGQTTNKGRSPYLDVLSRIKSLYALLIFCGICVIVRMAWISSSIIKEEGIIFSLIAQKVL